MARIHPTALVDPQAQLAADVEVGPYSVIGPHVSIDGGTKVGPHVVIEGHTKIGRDNEFYSFSAIGGPPQDKKYAGEPTRLEIGNSNKVREHCTFHVGTAQDAGVTRIGSHNWIMGNVHIAHDCQIGDHTILAHSAQLAGHVHIGDWVIVSGMSGVHQFVHVGPHAMVAAGAILLQDLPPYVMFGGNPPQPHGLNVEGLRRRGFDAATINLLKRAYKALYREGRTIADACTAIEALAAEAQAGNDTRTAESVRLFGGFVAASKRGIVR
ncbi:MAG TPA: acyl-ACP--UDP-N-acetylglucosamine O-acyltransferase [Burkholderiaceae bacterium]|nr:acyl-ACP--UDP-N-acetylglucosamine O-acyltransferase [Burkholderiaceae bacterium]